MTITIITEPSVYLVGVPSINGGALDKFLNDHGIADWTTDATTAAEALPECAGRLCYFSFAKPRPGGNAAYLRHILEAAHGSVLEHSVFNLILTGVSRSFTHELVRHRAGYSFSQLSQRYVDESDVAFVVPPALRDDVDAATSFYWTYKHDHVFDDYTDAFERSWVTAETTPLGRSQVAGLRWLAGRERDIDEYQFIADRLSQKLSELPATARRKQAREAARSVLPNCTETKIFVSANARSWRHFVEMRSDPGADAEMRRVAIVVLTLLQAATPNLFGDYVVEGGTATTPYRKV